MERMRWLGWCSLVLLVASLMWTTGCGSDDDDGGTTTVVVTNETGGTTVVTNAPAPPASPEPQATVAPQLVSPPNNQNYNSFGGESVEVRFEWTHVPGAQSYILQVTPGLKYAVPGEAYTMPLSVGVYQWKVWGTDADIYSDGNSGPTSATHTVTIVAAVGPPPP